MHAAATVAVRNAVRYGDRGTYLWLWNRAPYSWKGKVRLVFTTVPLGSLHPAGSWTDPAVVEGQLRRIERGGALAPLVVCATGSGALYIQDGNHRYEALQAFFAGDAEAPVRVALAVPRLGYRFRYHWFGTYGTYLLVPAPPPMSAAPAPFASRTMSLVPAPEQALEARVAT